MKKGITVLAILFVTIAMGIWELISVRNTLTEMETVVVTLYDKFEESEDDITIYYDEVTLVKEFWEDNENWLCFLFNHRDLSTITDSINKLQAYTKNNDYDNSVAELSLLREYSTKSYHIMGFNIHNIL